MESMLREQLRLPSGELSCTHNSCVYSHLINLASVISLCMYCYLSHLEKSEFHIRMFTPPTHWLPSKNFLANTFLE